jgi:hypothetical protein
MNIVSDTISPTVQWWNYVVMLNPVHGEVYLIQHHVIKYVDVSDLWQACGFLRLLRFPPQIKLTVLLLSLCVSVNA